MFTKGQKVFVTDGKPEDEGVIDQVSTWHEQLGKLHPETPAYFVRVQAWDHGTNGGRWIGPGGLRAA